MNNRRRKKTSASSFVVAVLTAAILIVIALLERNAMGDLSASDSSVTEVSERSMKQLGTAQNYNVTDSLKALEQWSEELLKLDQAGVRWTIRWDMQLEKDSLADMAQQLYIDQYNKPLNKVISQGGTHIFGKIPQHNGTLILKQVANDSGNIRVTGILQLEQDASSIDNLKDYVYYADEMIQSFGNDISVSTKITGVMQEDGWKRIQSVTESTLVEEYKDKSMKVVTAYSANLQKKHWLIGNKMINLQYAVYNDEDSGNSILTLAIPLISGEFGEISTNEGID